MGNGTNGETIFNAASIMVSVGEEVNAMFDKLLPLLQEKLKPIEGIRLIEVGNDDEFNHDTWVCTDYIANYNIYRTGRGNSRPAAYIGIQVKLCDKEEAEIGGHQPLLYVLFSRNGEWELNEFLLNGAKKKRFELEDGCLWKKYDEGAKLSQERFWYEAEEEWAFVVSFGGD